MLKIFDGINTESLRETYEKTVVKFIYNIGEAFYLILNTISCSFSRPFYFHRLTEQIRCLGVDSLAITCVIGIAMGLVMTLN
ncbi:MAG: hypothetical protein WCG27_12640, partial [Pseudomonadota bacterium]